MIIGPLGSKRSLAVVCLAGVFCWLVLVGALEDEFYDFPIILGMSSSQLTHLFFRGIETTNQGCLVLGPVGVLRSFGIR